MSTIAYRRASFSVGSIAGQLHFSSKLFEIFPFREQRKFNSLKLGSRNELPRHIIAKSDRIAIEIERRGDGESGIEYTL